MANKHASATTREFTIEYLKTITDNFSEKHKIGEGGYGVVYKGALGDGEEIALKMFYNLSIELDDKQFTNEFNNLMRAQHPNIIRLVGYCYHTENQRMKHNGEYIFALEEKRVLCFDYMERGSLEKYISGDRHIYDESFRLDWNTCFNIIVGVCKGLDYLHNGCEVPIYHLDLKPANILLDQNMVPKIGDFGLSRLFTSEKTCTATKVIGTIGYMPPEYISGREISNKFDVFSLGVIIVQIIAGAKGCSQRAEKTPQECFEQVHENWKTRQQETMPHTSEQIKTCIELAFKCLDPDRTNRPTIAEILREMNNVDTAESSRTNQVAKNQNSNPEHRGRIAFSATNKPPVPFDIFSCPICPSSTEDELHITDGVSYNYNGRPIPPAALKTLLKNPKLKNVAGATDVDVDTGHVSGLVFVSERYDGLETLYVALHFNVDDTPRFNVDGTVKSTRFKVHGTAKVFALADIFGTADFSGVRLEDSGCIGGGYNVGSRMVDYFLIYVSTKEKVYERRSPWTVVYKTNLESGKTERLTPKGVFDLSPAVSPSGKTIAVASFESNSWNGEIENLKTDIYVMNVDSEDDQDLGRKLLIKDGGWPSWGSDNIIFFHRGRNRILHSGKVETYWGVFRYNITTKKTVRVTPKRFQAVTPAAISETKVAVLRITSSGYRHIEIFNTNAPSEQITQKTRPYTYHYNPFVLDCGRRIGYHRCSHTSDFMQHGDTVRPNLHKLDSPVKDVGLFRVSGLFPAISNDGSKLAFVDNKFKTVWVADNQGLRVVYEERQPSDCVFSPVWNQNPDKDILYICVGTFFDAQEPLEIWSISNASGDQIQRRVQRLTYGGFNNMFPSSNPDGDKLVFRSTRDFLGEMGDSLTTRDLVAEEGNSPLKMWSRRLLPTGFWEAGSSQRKKNHKNLYIIQNEECSVTRLTYGPWTDTHCQWSPKGDWIVFSSTRDKPGHADELDNGLDPGYFSVFLVKASDPTMVIRVIDSGGDLGGHINHPVFSPDGRSIAMTADLAAVSVEPISLPKFKHPVRHYGEIFVVDINPDESNKDDVIKGFHRMTHSRYECGMPAWTRTLLTTDLDEQAQWNMLLEVKHPHTLVCPYMDHELHHPLRLFRPDCLLPPTCSRMRHSLDSN